MEIKDLRLAAIGLCGVYATSALAIEPASIDVKGIDVIPKLSVQVGHNDNIFSTETNETSSTITVVNPSVQFVAEKDNDAYRVTYDLKVGTLHDSRADDYVDHTLTGEAILELNSRNRLDLTAGLAKIHEDRGSNNAATGAKPARYTDTSLSGVYRYGAEGAAGNLEVGASYLDHAYDNLGTLNDSRERENIRLDATFFYRVAPKTRALFEVRAEDIDYKLTASDLDNTEMKYLAGVTWDATAKTSGTAKIGYQNKDYDAVSREDQDGASWEVSARWSPRTYSTFDLATSQEYEEASGNEDGIDTETYSLTWNHSWDERISTQAMLSHMNEDYIGLTREDETDTAMVGVNYELKRWLSMNLAYTYKDKDSNALDESETQNLFMLTFQGSL